MMIDTSNNDRIAEIATRHAVVRKRSEFCESSVGMDWYRVTISAKQLPRTWLDLTMKISCNASC
jgi:hypothetical protein